MTVRTSLRLFLAAASLALAALPAVSAWAAGYKVVVNANVAYAGAPDEAKQIVRRIFLKEATAWPGGPDATPLGRKTDDPAFTAFLSNVLGMTQAEYDAHWARLKQTTGDTPPREVGSASILERLIAKRDGTVGLVSADEAANLGEGVKVLFEY